MIRPDDAWDRAVMRWLLILLKPFDPTAPSISFKAILDEERAKTRTAAP